MDLTGRSFSGWSRVRDVQPGSGWCGRTFSSWSGIGEVRPMASGHVLVADSMGAHTSVSRDSGA